MSSHALLSSEEDDDGYLTPGIDLMEANDEADTDFEVTEKFEIDRFSRNNSTDPRTTWQSPKSSQSLKSILCSLVLCCSVILTLFFLVPRSPYIGLL
jgi:hypothetical protein